MLRTVLAHLRAQWAGFLALFLVIAGGTALAATLPKNSVSSKTVKNSSLKSKDLKDGEAVSGADVIPEQVQLRVGESCPEGQAIRVINVQGGVICAAGDGSRPGGTAGGDLTGTYPDPTIADGVVDSAKIANGTVTGDDIGSHAVGQANIDGTDHYGSLGLGGISDGRCTTVSVSVAGAKPGDAGILTTDGTLPDGELLYLQRVLNDLAHVKACNLSGGSLPAVSVNVRILTFH